MNSDVGPYPFPRSHDSHVSHDTSSPVHRWLVRYATDGLGALADKAPSRIAVPPGRPSPGTAEPTTQSSGTSAGPSQFLETPLKGAAAKREIFSCGRGPRRITKKGPSSRPSKDQGAAATPHAAASYRLATRQRAALRRCHESGRYVSLPCESGRRDMMVGEPPTRGSTHSACA